MSKFNLFENIPAIYRLEDLKNGQPLEVFFSVIQENFDALSTSLLSDYLNWFIETCEEWAVPGIGALVDAGVDTHVNYGASQRYWAANSTYYYQFNGSKETLDRQCRDRSLLPVKIYLPNDNLSFTQSVNAVTPQKGRLFNVRHSRQWSPYPYVHNPFRYRSLSINVRKDAPGGITRVNGVMTQLHIATLFMKEACQMTQAAPIYSMNPFSVPTPLFKGYGHASKAWTYFPKELSQLSAANALNHVQVSVENTDGTLHTFRKKEITVGSINAATQSKQLIIDLDNGYIQLPKKYEKNTRVFCSYSSTLAHNIGAGPDQHFTNTQSLISKIQHSNGVSYIISTTEMKLNPAVESEAVMHFQSLQDAMEDYHQRDQSQPGLFILADSCHYTLTATDAMPFITSESPIEVVADAYCVPSIDWQVPIAHPDSAAPSSIKTGLTITGISLTNTLVISGPASLMIIRCTSDPKKVALRTNHYCRITIDSSICGRIHAGPNTFINATKSIIDASISALAIAYNDDPNNVGPVIDTLSECTIIGDLCIFGAYTITKTIIVGQLTAKKNSDTPKVVSSMCLGSNYTMDSGLIVGPPPVFHSWTFGQPGYMLLKQCRPQHFFNAFDNGQIDIGAFASDAYSQRGQDTRDVLNTYTPIGDQGVLFYD